MDQLSSATFGIAIGAALIYLWLRLVAQQDNRPALTRARSHSFWCALIAFFVCTSGSAGDLKNTVTGTDIGVAEVIDAINPGLWLLLIYLLGLYSWPKSVTAVRAASLEPRSVFTPLPRALSLIAVLVFFGSATALFFIRDVAGYPAQFAVETFDSTGGGGTLQSAQEGLAEAATLIPLYSLSLASLGLALLIATALILFRKPLGSLTPHDNQVIRAVWLNRLLRTAILGFATVGVAALQYKSSWLLNLYPEADDYRIWQNVGNFAMLLIFILVAAWAPPANFVKNADTVPSSAFSRMRENIFSLGFITTALSLVGMALMPWSRQAEISFDTRPGEDAPQVMLLLAGFVALYLALNAGYLGYVHHSSKSVHHQARNIRNLPRYVYILAGILIIVSGYLLINPPLKYFWGLVKVGPTFALLMVLAVLVLTAGYIWWARRVSLPWQVSAEQEIWYRRVLEFRALRTVTAAIIMMPGWGYAPAPYLWAAAVIVFCCPAVIFLARPAAKVRQLV